MRLPRPTSASAPAHFVWLFGAAVFLFAGVIWGGSKAHAVELSPAEAASQEAIRSEADRVALLGRLQLAGIAERRAGPPRATGVVRPLSAPRPDDQQLALARYMTVVGADSIETIVTQSGSRLADEVLADRRIELDGAGRADVASGGVDARVLALLLYLAEAHGEVTVSCLITGHSHFVAQTPLAKTRKLPRVVSAHVAGRAVDISALGGIPIIGNQQPGGITDRAIREILSLPSVLQPAQVISLLDLSGPSFRLPDHTDHLHVGY